MKRREENRGAMREKWETMSEEEREAARQEFRERAESRREIWNNMSDEEKEAARQQMREQRDKPKNKHGNRDARQGRQ